MEQPKSPEVRKLTRKNLMVENDKVRELARIRGQSESEAVREAVDFALAAERIGAALRRLHEIGGIDDVFDRLPPDGEPDGRAPTGT
jgi:hypothetical protein